MGWQWDPHHIISRYAWDAEPARQKLLDILGSKDKVDEILDSAINGVWLPRNADVENPSGAAVHQGIHSPKYYEEVNSMIALANNMNDIIDTLNYIKRVLSG